MTISYMKSNNQILTRLLDKLSVSKSRERYRSTIANLKQRLRPEKQDANFLNGSKNEEMIDINDQPVPPLPEYTPAPPKSRISFIDRSTSSAPVKTRRVTISEENADDDLDELLTQKIRQSIKIYEEPVKKTNKKAAFFEQSFERWNRKG